MSETAAHLRPGDAPSFLTEGLSEGCDRVTRIDASQEVLVVKFNGGGMQGPKEKFVIAAQHNNNGRDGANLAGTILELNDGGVTKFGKRFELPVAGAVYAQPLYVPDLAAGDRKRNVLYVATMRNQVTAFDADVPQSPLWQRQLAPSIQLCDSQAGQTGLGGSKDTGWEVGILSTPVIDTSRRAIYVVSASKQPGGNIIHQLWKLDLATGNGLQPPTTISGSAGRAMFDSAKQLQRSALLLSQNKVYVAFASYGDSGPYSGWVFSFDADTLAHVQTTPQPAGDHNLRRLDSFLPHDRWPHDHLPHHKGQFDGSDTNLGSSSGSNSDSDLCPMGMLVVPGANLIIGGGKEGVLYLMDMSHLGGHDANADDGIDLFATSRSNGNCPFHDAPAFWQGPDGPHIYVLNSARPPWCEPRFTWRPWEGRPTR